MTSSQLASRTVFIFVKIALVGYAGFVANKKPDQQQNCSVHSRASSSLKNPQCSAVGEAEVSSDLQSSFHSPIEWACDRVTDSHPPTNEPCRQTLLLAGAPGCFALFRDFLVGWLTRGPAWSFLLLFREGQ